jgi:hypothetical protein
VSDKLKPEELPAIGCTKPSEPEPGFYTDFANGGAGGRPIEAVTLEWFSGFMSRKLRENSHKPSWRLDILGVLCARLDEERVELDDAISGFLAARHVGEGVSDAAEAAILECADIANFAMMVADRIRLLGES